MSKSEALRLTRAQVREIDRRSIEEFHIPGIVLMENAARTVAGFAFEAADNYPHEPAFVFCGPGNNGGDGLAAARHLHNKRMKVEIVLAVDPSTYQGDARTNWEIVQRMRISVRNTVPDYHGTEVPIYVDALFGTGLTRSPQGVASDFIEHLNASGAYIIAVDLPSGLECDTGEPFKSCVRATETITFVAEKAGFANPVSKEYTGLITVADIGCPRELIEEVARRS